jgi:hypothetical protein
LQTTEYILLNGCLYIDVYDRLYPQGGTPRKRTRSKNDSKTDGLGRDEGVVVGAVVGVTVSTCVGDTLGVELGTAVGVTLGVAVGGSLGTKEGSNVSDEEGVTD